MPVHPYSASCQCLGVRDCSWGRQPTSGATARGSHSFSFARTTCPNTAVTNVEAGVLHSEKAWWYTQPRILGRLVGLVLSHSPHSCSMLTSAEVGCEQTIEFCHLLFLAVFADYSWSHEDAKYLLRYVVLERSLRSFFVMVGCEHRRTV